MTYDHIETFLTVVVCGTISGAAKRLYVSQSTISSRIQQLELELDAQLFVRQKGHRSISLTSYGESFIPIASQWAALWKDTQALKAAEDVRTISIASVDAVNNYTFVPLFEKHMETYSQYRLAINTHHSNEIYGLVENHTVDMGFVFSAISYPDVISIPIYREFMYLICHKDSGYEDDISCTKLDPEQEIFLNWGNDYRQWHERHWNPDRKPLLSVNTGSMLQRFLDRPGRWGIAPMSVINGAMKSNPNLVFRKLKDSPSPRICYEIKNRYPKISHQKGIEVLEEEIAKFVEKDNNICTFEEWMLKE